MRAMIGGEDSSFPITWGEVSCWFEIGGGRGIGDVRYASMLPVGLSATLKRCGQRAK